jgi:Domain of unknown function (DUF3384)/Tuberin
MASTPDKPRRKPSTILNLFRNFTTTASSPAAAADENNGFAVQMGTDLDGARLNVSGGPPQLEKLLPQLQLDRPLAERISAAKEIAAILEQYRLSNVLAIWSAASDLPSHESAEASYAGFKLLVSCVKCSSLSLAERATFSKAIYETGGNEHLDFRFQALLELTDNGRNVEGLEGRLISFLSCLLEVSFKIAPKSRKKDKKPDLAEPGETLLGRLFQFTVDVIKFNSAVLRDDDFILILDQIVSICQKTTNKSDIINSMNVMAAFVTYTNIKSSAFRPCLELLCDVHRQLGKLREQTWATLELVFGSNLRTSAIADLIEVLHLAGNHRPESKIVRGAFNVLSVLVRKNGTGGLPHVPLGVLVESANASILHSDDRKVELDVLNFYSSVLTDPELRSRLLKDVDWDHFTKSLLNCAHGLDVISPDDALGLKNNSDHEFSEMQYDIDRGEAHKLFNEVIQQLSSITLSFDIIKQDQTVALFIALGGALTNDAAETLAAFAATKPLTTPSAKNFETTCRHFTVHFIHDKTRPQRLRKSMVKLLRNSFDTIQYVSTDYVVTFATDLLQNLSLEEDPIVLEELCLFACEALRSIKRDELFHHVWSLLTSAVLQIRSSPDQSALHPDTITSPPEVPSSTLQPPSLCRIIVGHITTLFFEAMTDDTKHADLLFDFILEVARNSSLEIDARICALRLLFRIRSRGRLDIYVVQESDSQSMAVVLGRTHDTAISPPPADSVGSAIEYRNSVIVSGATARSKPPSFPRPTPVWLFPGPRDLTHDIISHFLCSDTPINAVPKMESSVLKVTHWLEAVIMILQQPSVDWEIYSFVLVHLGAQLKNQSLFTTAMPQIQLLRSVICDQIRAESFHTPPSHTSLRKADVAICLFHTLTMLVSYNACFAKSEEDEIIRSFMLGIGSWDRTSKWCIHGLSVCCHELPLSASKSLDTIIQKMSQIITQPQIAIHILEFLCSLARLPELYKNFREDEYKVVFGVSFRYLQYVRDQREKEEESKQLTASTKISKRNSDSVREIKGPTDHDMRTKLRSSPEELPQYVYALAFHVITFWYMALKLRDRPMHMSWIANSLTYIDRSGNEIIEDQGVVTMDMMERLAYSDRDETCYNYDFARPTDGEVSKKTWIIGLSLLTIQTAGRTGLSQVTRRRPVSLCRTVDRFFH